MISTFFLVILAVAVILAMIFVFILCLYKFILTPYKDMLADYTLDELFTAVNVVIQNEISMYERNVLDNGGKIISNSTYEKYYADIFSNIAEALSPALTKRISFYINKQSLYMMISREIKIYLNDKIM